MYVYYLYPIQLLMHDVDCGFLLWTELPKFKHVIGKPFVAYFLSQFVLSLVHSASMNASRSMVTDTLTGLLLLIHLPAHRRPLT